MRRTSGPCGGRNAAFGRGAAPCLQFEAGRVRHGNARSVHGERRRPSDGRLRRERASADGQQCERDCTHRACLPPSLRLLLCARRRPSGAQGYLRGLQECIRTIGTQGVCRSDISTFWVLPAARGESLGMGDYKVSTTTPDGVARASKFTVSKVSTGRRRRDARVVETARAGTHTLREVVIARHSKNS